MLPSPPPLYLFFLPSTQVPTHAVSIKDLCARCYAKLVLFTPPSLPSSLFPSFPPFSLSFLNRLSQDLFQTWEPKDEELSKIAAISVQNLKLKMFEWKTKFKNIDVYFSKTPLNCQGPSVCVSFPIVANQQGMCVPETEE